MLSQDILKQVSNLSNEDNMSLIASILKTEPDTDNYGQYVFYTGLTENDDGELVPFEG